MNRLEKIAGSVVADEEFRAGNNLKLWAEVSRRINGDGEFVRAMEWFSEIFASWLAGAALGDSDYGLERFFKAVEARWNDLMPVADEIAKEVKKERGVGRTSSIKRISARKANKVPPYPGNKADAIEADDSQKRELEDILGPEALYGGGVIEAFFEPSIDIDGNRASVNGTLYVLTEGDWTDMDEEGRWSTGPRWLKFDVGGGLDFYYHEAVDEDDYSGWERNEIVYTRNMDLAITNVFEQDIVYRLDSLV